MDNALEFLQLYHKDVRIIEKDELIKYLPCIPEK